MGQSCSLCDSDRQAEVNLDELRHASVGEGVAEVHVHKGTREKKEKKDKKSKKAKKEKRAAESPSPDLDPPAEEHGRSPKVPLIRLTLPLGASVAEAVAAGPCVLEDGAAALGSCPDAAEPARQQATPVAPLAGPGQHGARRWSTLPSVGTWLKPLPRGPARVAAAAAQEAADATEPLQGALCPVTTTSSVESFVALAASALEADVAKPLHEQPDLIDLFECPPPVKVTAPPPAVEEEAPAEDRVAQEALLAEAFLAEALAWPAADKEHCLPSGEERAEAAPVVAQAASCEPPPLPPQVRSAGAAPPWYLRPSVGTWLHVKVRPLPPAPAASCPPNEEAPATAVAPDAAVDAARAASPPEAGGATTTSAIGGHGGRAADVEISYGLEPSLSWQKEAPLAIPSGSSPDAEACASTTTLADGNTTASLLSRRIISM